MTEAETRYSTLKNMALAVMTSARKLRSYFPSHSIVVLANLPLRTIMQNSNHAGRLSKCAIELGEYDVTFKSKPVLGSKPVTTESMSESP